MINDRVVCIKIVDTDTAELHVDKELQLAFGDKVDAALQRYLDCFKRGIRHGKNLRLDLNVYKPFVYEGNIFDPNVCAVSPYQEQIY